MDHAHALKTCPICLAPFGPRRQDSPDPQTRARGRHAFKRRRFCGVKCQGLAQRRDPERQAKTRTGAGKTACRLKPKRPCERCGETRRSQVHHKDRDFMNNALDNLERLCHWCHAAEHAPETKARAAHHWAVRRARYGPGGHR